MISRSRGSLIKKNNLLNDDLVDVGAEAVNEGSRVASVGSGRWPRAVSAHCSISERSQSMQRPRPRLTTGRGMSA